MNSGLIVKQVLHEVHDDRLCRLVLEEFRLCKILVEVERLDGLGVNDKCMRHIWVVFDVLYQRTDCSCSNLRSFYLLDDPHEVLDERLDDGVICSDNRTIAVRIRQRYRVVAFCMAQKVDLYLLIVATLGGHALESLDRFYEFTF